MIANQRQIVNEGSLIIIISCSQCAYVLFLSNSSLFSSHISVKSTEIFFQRKWRVSCLRRRSSLFLILFVYTSTRFLTFFSLLDVCIFHWMHASASISRFDSTNEKFFSHFFLWTFTLIIMLCIKWHTTSNSRDQWNSLMIVWLKKVGNLAFGLSRKSLSKTSPCMHASDFNSYS
jgi:hypothetical protein